MLEDKDMMEGEGMILAGVLFLSVVVLCAVGTVVLLVVLL